VLTEQDLLEFSVLLLPACDRVTRLASEEPHDGQVFRLVNSTWIVGGVSFLDLMMLEVLQGSLVNLLFARWMSIAAFFPTFSCPSIDEFTEYDSEPWAFGEGSRGKILK